LAGAFSESLSNELRLLKKYGIATGLSAIGMSKALFALGPGPLIQFTIDTARLGNEVVSTLVNWKKAAQIQKMMEKAQTGDPEAKIELIRNHAKYAKGLLAYKAQQGDPFAVQYVKKRGLEESDIKKSSQDIITHYLMKMGEQSGNYETFGKWLEKKKAVPGKFLSAVDNLIGNPWKKTTNFFKKRKRDNELRLDIFPDVIVPLETAQSLVDWIQQGSDILAQFQAENDPKTLDKRKIIEDELVEKREQLSEYRSKTLESLAGLSDAEKMIAGYLAKNSKDLSKTEKKEIAAKQHALPHLRKEHLKLSDILSTPV